MVRPMMEVSGLRMVSIQSLDVPRDVPDSDERR
jgi:hypothetical protein